MYGQCRAETQMVKPFKTSIEKINTWKIDEENKVQFLNHHTTERPQQAKKAIMTQHSAEGCSIMSQFSP